MRIKTIIWEQNGVEIEQIVPECECGGIAERVGYAGCSHSDEYTYTYQCPKCKTIEMFDRTFSHNDSEDFASYGWKIKT